MKLFRRVLATAFVFGLLTVTAGAADKGEWTGWITDDHCGAKGAKEGHEACARKCIDGGGKAVFYNTEDKKIYQLDNQDLAKEHAGHQVKVKGEVDGEAIKVESIEMVKAKSK
jgi:hypothetical protein